MRISSVEWLIMAAELALGFAIASMAGWPVWAGLAISIPTGIVVQWLYRRGGSDRQQAKWLFECAYTLRNRGGLSWPSAVSWATKLNDRFSDRWTGRQAAEHQIEQWQN